MSVPAAAASFRPDESAAAIFSEHTWLQGAFLACVAYGIQLVLGAMCVSSLWGRTRTRGGGWRGYWLVGCVGVMFVLSTLYMAGLMEFTQQAFIDARDIPGGPSAYEDIEYSIPIDMLANVAVVVIAWMCDAINIWRCFVIYQSSNTNTNTGSAVIALPVLLFLASVALGILWLKQVGTPSSSPWATFGINFTTPYFALSLALNILVTVLIVGRLILYRRQLTKIFPVSGTDHGRYYTSLAAMVVESAAIYSLFSMLFLVPFCLGHPLSQLFLQALCPVQALSAFLIILRISQGKAWSPKTAVEAFSTQDAEGTKWASVRSISPTDTQTPDGSGTLKRAATAGDSDGAPTISLRDLSKATILEFDPEAMDTKDSKDI